MARSTLTTNRTEMNPERTCSTAVFRTGFKLALLLLASGAGVGGRLPPVRGQAVQGRAGHARQDRDVLHDAGRGRHAHLHR